MLKVHGPVQGSAQASAPGHQTLLLLVLGPMSRQIMQHTNLWEQDEMTLSTIFSFM